MSRSLLALVVALVGIVAPVFAVPAGAEPPPGALVQLPSPAACLSSTAASGCAPFGLAVTLDGAGPLAISDDGANVYAGALGFGGVEFARDANGALTTIAGGGAPGTQAYVTGGAGVFGAVGHNAINNGEVDAFSRTADGTLAFAGSVADSCPLGSTTCATDNGLDNVFGVTIAPDGGHVYAAAAFGGGGHSGALTVFSRNQATQALAQVQCVPSAIAGGICNAPAATPALATATDVALSPDGKFAYATGLANGAVVGFNVVQSGASAGQLGNQVDCLWSVAPANGCRQTSGTDKPYGLAISPDGRDVYVVSFGGGVGALRRDTTSGVLSFTQCITPAGGGGCAPDAALTGSTFGVAVSPDGRYVYVAGGATGQVGYVLSYARDAASGGLTRIGCLSNLVMQGCTTAAGLAQADKVVVSPDGRFVYVTAAQGGDGNGAVVAFRVQAQPAPVVTPPVVTPPAVTAKDTTRPRSRVVGLKRRVKAKALKRFRGTANDDRGLARVEVSLVRLRGGARIARATCTALNAKGRFHALKVRHGRCAVSGFLRAKGTTRWSFPLKHRLPKGSYVLTVRATDTSGNVENGFSARKGDRFAFTVS